MRSATSPTTKPCPEDQATPIAPTRSTLADIALAAGIEASDVRAYLSATYRLKASDIGLAAVSP